ncbi:MAG: iron uptake porin [Leptolyngbyaceae bacterium]|nr:iron uptake porin [Leptolyngbyaceae bacterium]
MNHKPRHALARMLMLCPAMFGMAIASGVMLWPSGDTATASELQSVADIMSSNHMMGSTDLHPGASSIANARPNGMRQVTGVQQLSRPAADTSEAQVTSISQLSDVEPTDWAFQALQSLVERYGCIAGYPDATFRGNRALTRYEFAAGLNACLDRINELIAAGLADKVSREDLAVLQRLQEEFAAELATLRGRVDALEARTAELEANQFSTTTKLNAVTVFHYTDLGFSGDLEREIGARDPITGEQLSTTATDAITEPNFTALSWMNLTSSFTGEDSLNIQFDVSTGSGVSSPANAYVSAGLFNTWGTPFTQQGSNDTFRLRELFYAFPAFGDKVDFIVGPQINIYRHFDGNPYNFILGAVDSFNSSGGTQFASLDRGAGAVAIVPFGDFDFRLGYMAENNEFLDSTAPDPTETRGLFGGVNTLVSQLSFSPSSDFQLNLIYARTNNTPPGGDGLIGGALSEPLGGLIDDGESGGGIGTASANTYIANFSWQFLPNVAVFGRYSYGDYALWRPSDEGGGRIGDVVAQSVQAGLAFPDVGKEGALASISYLIPYSYIDGREFVLSGAGGPGGVQWEVEAAYFYPLTDNIALSPRVYIINNPNNFNDNPTVIVGNLRTQFRF